MRFEAWVMVVVVAAVLTFGILRARVDGRFTGTRRVRGIASEAEPATGQASVNTRGGGDSVVSLLADTGFASSMGERATLVQFSSAFCAPCRATRAVLSTVAQVVPGVSHVEIDAEQHLDLVRELGVLRTPTTLILDETGRERTRAAGALKRDTVMAALADVVAQGPGR